MLRKTGEAAPTAICLLGKRRRKGFGKGLKLDVQHRLTLCKNLYPVDIGIQKIRGKNFHVVKPIGCENLIRIKGG